MWIRFPEPDPWGENLTLPLPPTEVNGNTPIYFTRIRISAYAFNWTIFFILTRLRYSDLLWAYLRPDPVWHWTPSTKCQMYPNPPKFSTLQIWALCEEPCHVCLLWMHPRGGTTMQKGETDTPQHPLGAFCRDSWERCEEHSVCDKSSKAVASGASHQGPCIKVNISKTPKGTGFNMLLSMSKGYLVQKESPV